MRIFTYHNLRCGKYKLTFTHAHMCGCRSHSRSAGVSDTNNTTNNTLLEEAVVMATE
jgi:hypothetical protein